jgi:3-hydroxyacyl-CoA dehydrogenase/enoyl-CoA hydratase/3-hydroxybutyryl-CoA epimerase
MSEANALGARPPGFAPRQFRGIGMLGAGMMGSGIAYAAASAGLDVVLLDVDAKAAERGKDYSRKQLAKLVEKGRMPQPAADALLARIKPTSDFAALAACDLVIEGVYEDRTVKAEVTRKAEAAMRTDAIFASNTSTLPISGLARASCRPENFIGLHFFSPAERMPLIEIIRGERTSDATQAHAMDFAKLLGKTPVVVHDGRGFYTSRVLRAYLSEAVSLLEEGVAPETIENASLVAGMPIGPLALLDDVSLELMVKFAKQDEADLGSAYRGQALDRVATLMVESLGRPGRKAGKGFYDYPSDGKKRLWDGLAEVFPLRPEQPSIDDVVERLLLIQTVETARCMEDGVVRRAQDADVGAVLGWGYPSLRGGPIGWIHTLGIPEFVAACDRLAEQAGPRFVPPALLRNMSSNGEAFYHL